jgi:hypothetical protein
MFAQTIAFALEQQLGASHRAVKTVMAWTGANERTVKNWLSGKNGPSGEYLVEVVRRSDLALTAFLKLAGRDELAGRMAVFEARNHLQNTVNFIDSLKLP